MNYKLKSQQSIPDENNIGEDQKNFRYNEQYYNIQNNRVMQLPAMELRQQAVDGEKNMEIYSNEDQEQVTRRMNFHFQKKVEADKEGLEEDIDQEKKNMEKMKQLNNFVNSNGNQNMNEIVNERQYEKDKEAQKRKEDAFQERMMEEYKQAEMKESQYSVEGNKPEKLIYHHRKTGSNIEMKTDALGKFFVDKDKGNTNQKSKTFLSNQLMKNLNK
jgi:hypothetical protein